MDLGFILLKFVSKKFDLIIQTFLWLLSIGGELGSHMIFTEMLQLDFFNPNPDFPSSILSLAEF